MTRPTAGPTPASSPGDLSSSSPTSSSCSRLHRWWHARQRRADIRWLLPSLVAAVLRRRVDPEYGVWALVTHMDLPGQAHWRCPCAYQSEARTRAFEALRRGVCRAREAR
jgi:hypothetical protein